MSNTGTEKDNRGFSEKTTDFAGNHWRRILFGIAAAALASRSYQIVPAQSYGVRVTAGQLMSDTLKPGIYFKYPAFDKIHIFNNNTIIMENTVGATGKDEVNSSDRNPISVDLRTHYKVNPKVGSIALKLPDMEGNNGENILDSMENQSANAVFGGRPASESLNDPAGFLQAFLANLQWRISQNNLPLEVDTIELLNFHADLHRPEQLRIKADGHVEQMVGPAAVSVTHGGTSASATAPITEPQHPADGQATTSVAPKPSSTPVQP